MTPGIDRRPWRRALDGAACPWRGLVYTAAHPRLWPWLALPAVLFVVVVVPTAWWTWGRFPEWLAAIARPPAGGALLGLWWIAMRVLTLVVVVAVAAAEWVLVTVVTRPAYAIVAGWVEDDVTGRTPDAGLRVMLADAALSVAHSLLGLAAYAVGAVAIAGLAAIPVVGEVLAPVLWVGLGALWLARELVDGPLSRRRLGFADKLRFLARHWPEMLGLGGLTGLFLAVPIVDLVLLPAAFVGATLWVVEHDRPAGRDAAG